MVALCGILAVVVTALLANVVVAQDYTFCSNTPGVTDSLTGLPSQTPPADSAGRIQLGFSSDGPCLMAMDHSAPPSLPYAPPVNLSYCDPQLTSTACPLAASYVPTASVEQGVDIEAL
jgi:hypothetical protein